MPKARACWFINSANSSSLPAAYSAKATLASLPDWMITPFNSASTLTSLPTSMNMREPCMRHAFSLTITLSSREIWP